MAPFQIRFGLQISPSHSDEEEEEDEEDEFDDEEEEFDDEEEELDCEVPNSPPLMLPAARGVVSLVETVAAALRRSLVMCSVGAGEEGGDGEEGMQIGRPTDVRHVSHVTFDRFGGFLGLPADLEPEVPRPTPSASASVFGVSPTSMQCSYDKRGNSVPTILLKMQRKLYQLGGLQAEGIFRINAENSQEVYVRDQLNSGVVPDGVDFHCVAGLIKAWFRELPKGVLDSLTPEQVMHCNTEEECALLASMLPPVEAALLDWAINLMADVVEHENYNKMNARNIAMVFAPNMTQMADPLTALIHAVQVMNFLKTLILKTFKERGETAGAASALQSCSDSPSDKDEPQMSEHLDKPFICSSQKITDFPISNSATHDQLLSGAEQALQHDVQSGFEGLEKHDYESHGQVSPPGSDLSDQANSSGKELSNGNVEGLFDRFSFRKGVGRLCRHPVFQFSRSMKKSGEVVVIDAPGAARQAWIALCHPSEQWVLNRMISCDVCISVLEAVKAMTLSKGNNDYLFTLSKANAPPYGVDFAPSGGRPTGRFTNGRTIADIIGEALGHKSYAPPYLAPNSSAEMMSSGVNYASGSSGILDETGSLYIGRVPLGQQISYFEKTRAQILKTLGEKAVMEFLEKAVFAVTAGSNDILDYLAPSIPFFGREKPDPSVLQDAMVSNLTFHLKRLNKLGGRKFLVADVGPLGCIPYVRALKLIPTGKCSTFANQLTEGYNAKLKTVIHQLNKEMGPDSKFVYAKTYDIVIEIIQDYHHYGFESALDPCCGGSFPPFLCIGVANSSSSLCKDRSKYIFWDAFHPTEAANIVVANKLLDGDTAAASPINVRKLYKYQFK